MSLGDFLAEYKRRSRESIVAVLRERPELALRELCDSIADIPELRRLTLAEVFARQPAATNKPAPAPPSAAVRIAAYMMDLVTTTGSREGGGLRVRVPSLAEIGERVAATRDSVALTLAILERRGLITVSPRWVVVRDLRGLALVAERPLRLKRRRLT